MGRVGVEPTTPAMSRRYPNQARPPAQYTMKKFAAQIYVVDRLYMETNQPLPEFHKADILAPTEIK